MRQTWNLRRFPFISVHYVNLDHQVIQYERKTLQARSSLLGAESMHAVVRAHDACRGQLGAGDLLDLTGGTGSVVDHDALTKPHFGNVPLKRINLIRDRGRRQRQQGKSAESPECTAHGD
jgi:hypothetical protein